MERARVELKECGDCGLDGGVPWRLGGGQEVMTPGIELMGAPDPPYRRGGAVCDDPLHDELAHQLAAVPLRAAAAPRLGSLAGQAHHVDGHLGGEKALGP